MAFLQAFAVFAIYLGGCADAATAGTLTEVTSFSLPKSPSGMFFYASQDLLYVLCGTQTNGDHYLYGFTTAGVQKCFITIPAASKMARVDGFYIVGSDAYVVDSQGPMHATSLGGSIYKVDWTNPCACSSGDCATATATWSPVVTGKWTLSAADAAIADGGGNDQYFRNSGIVVLGDYMYAVNGVHPISGSLTGSYPKSLLKIKMADSSIAQKWSFTGTTVGRHVDMEGLTCGPDNCATHMYIGDEYNYIYKLKLSTSDPAVAVEEEWDINSVVGNVQADKGIESLAYAPSTGYFYAGIQGTAKVHVLQLSGSTTGTSTTSGSTTGTSATSGSTTGTTSTTSGSTTGTSATSGSTTATSSSTTGSTSSAVSGSISGTSGLFPVTCAILWLISHLAA